MNDRPAPTRRLYPIPEARAILGDISHSGFYKLVGQGAILLVHLGGRAFVTDNEIGNIVARIEAAAQHDTKNSNAGVAA